MIGDFILWLKESWKDRNENIEYFFFRCKEFFCIHEYEKKYCDKEIFGFDGIYYKCKKCGRIK